MKRLFYPLFFVAMIMWILVGCQEEDLSSSSDSVPVSTIDVIQEREDDVEVATQAVVEEPSQGESGLETEIPSPTALPTPLPTDTPQPTATELPPTQTPIPWVPITTQSLPALSRVDRLGKGQFERFSVDAQGDLIAVGTTFGVYLFDGRSLTEKTILLSEEELDASRRTVALSPNGQTVAVARDRKAINLYDTTTGDLVQQISTNDQYVYDLLFTTDNLNLIILYSDSTQVVSLADGGILRSIVHDEGDRLALSSDGNRFVVAATINAHPARVYDQTTGTLLGEYTLPSEKHIRDAALSSDGTLVAIVGDALSIWQVDDGVQAWSKPGLYYSVSFSPDGKQVAVAEQISGKVEVYAVADGTLQTTFQLPGIVTDMAFSPEEGILFTADLAGLTRWQVDDETTMEAQTEGFINWATSMAVTDDGRTVALGGEGGRVEVWDLDSKQRKQQFAGHTQAVKGITISPDGSLVASAGLDNIVRVWHVDDGDLVLEFEAMFFVPSSSPQDRLTYLSAFLLRPSLEIAFSPDGRYLALFSTNGLQLWDMESGSQIQQIQAIYDYEAGQLAYLTFSPDSSRLAFTYGLSGNIVSVPDGNFVGGVGDYIEAEDIVYSPEGQEIVMLGRTASDRQPFVQIWRVDNENPIRSYNFSETDSDWGGPLQFTPDGQHLILVDGAIFSSNNSLLFFDAVSGQLTHRIWRTGAIYDYSFSHDGTHLLTGVLDKGVIDIWAINPSDNEVSVLPTPTATLAPVNYDCNMVTEIPHQECEALLALYQYTHGEDWTDNSDWLQTTTPCSWVGISCSMTLNKVTHIILSGNNLQGTLPPSLDDFTSLGWLDLSDNALTGTIPPELGNSNIEQILLQNNALIGLIPAELGNLGDTLLSLDLSGNQLSGSLPDSLGNLTSLGVLFINNNPLNGSLPIAMTNMSGMFYLKFQDTQLCVPADSNLQSWLAMLPRLEQNDLICDP